MMDLMRFKVECEQKAREEVNGCRNARAAAVGIAKKKVPKRYTKKLKSAVAVLRVVGKELGTKKWSDRRDVLDYVTIEKITEKIVIGTCGERVPFDKIIAWGC